MKKQSVKLFFALNILFALTLVACNGNKNKVDRNGNDTTGDDVEMNDTKIEELEEGQPNEEMLEDTRETIDTIMEEDGDK
jgi:hypothetical protein